MIRILVVDDHAVVAEGLRSLIDAQGDMEVIGLAACGAEAVKQAAALQPDLVVMDNAMPEMSGIEATRLIRKADPDVRVVMLSMHSIGAHVQRALAAGAGGYVLKESVGRELLHAIRVVHEGKRYLSKPLADDLLKRLATRMPDDPLTRLSIRELQVLQLLAEGHSVIEVGLKLSLSRKTVETYRARMMEKLDLEDIGSLIKFALRNDLISLN